MLRYPVTLTPDEGTLLVRFPDVPEAITFGEDEAEALKRAVDALESALMTYMEDGKEIPQPSPIKRKSRSVALPALSEAKVELYRAMRSAGVQKAELARRLGWHMPQVDRLLDLNHASRLDQLEAAFAALNKRLSVQVRDAA